MAGRPPKDDADRRDKPLRIRLTDDERKIIDTAAADAGLTTSSWARGYLLHHALRSKKTGNK